MRKKNHNLFEYCVILINVPSYSYSILENGINTNSFQYSNISHVLPYVNFTSIIYLGM